MALRNSVGVALPLAIGFAAGSASAGLAMATGALNVSYYDSDAPYRQRGKRMLAASILVALAVFAGGITGQSDPTAVMVVGAWAFGTGILVALGSS